LDLAGCAVGLAACADRAGPAACVGRGRGTRTATLLRRQLRLRLSRVGQGLGRARFIASARLISADKQGVPCSEQPRSIFRAGLLLTSHQRAPDFIIIRTDIGLDVRIPYFARETFLEPFVLYSLSLPSVFTQAGLI
jgi:hypothetical protein